MHKERTLDNVYSACEKEGSFIPLAKIDKEQIKSMVGIALVDYDSAKGWAKETPKESGRWNAIYKIHYDVLHTLAEAFVLFDVIKTKTHEALFAYLCKKHEELVLDWGFLEMIRTKRNGSIYYGSPISYGDWKEAELKMNVYINAIKKAVEEKLKC